MVDPLAVFGPSIIHALSLSRPRGLPSQIGLPPDSDDEINEEDECPDYSGCGSDGIGYWNTLQETLFNAQAVDRSMCLGLFEDHYNADLVPSLHS